MPEFVVRRLGRLGAWLLAAVLVVIITASAYMGVRRYFTKDLTTQVEVGRAQTGAAIESGHQAVEIVGARQQTEAGGAAVVQETKDAINRSADPGAVTSAGLDGLHRVRREAVPGPRK